MMRSATGSELLGDIGQVTHFDLLIAAAAGSADVTLLHYDADFDTIGSVTGQPTEWILPRGSV